VRSVVGRFLEHSRVFYFHADGASEVYLASADWMERNFFRRVEIAFPVLDPRLRQRVIREGLRPYLSDNGQAWVMAADGSYTRRVARGRAHRAQEELLALLADQPAKRP
jgi:polyphosphate kinase